ncbi:MAG: sensor domain-containing diguanylate cyclase [Raoultibacter sp.]
MIKGCLHSGADWGFRMIGGIVNENALREHLSALGPLPCARVRLLPDEGSRMVASVDEYCALAGYSHAEIKKEPRCDRVRNLVLEDDLKRFDAEMQEIVEDKRTCIRYRIRKLDGSIAWQMAYAVTVIAADEGTVADMLVFDITAEAEGIAEGSLGGASDDLRACALPRMLNVIVTEHDLQDQILSIPEQEGLCGLGRKSIKPMSSDEFIASGLLHPDSIAAYLAFLKKLEKEDTADTAVRYRVAAETYHWVHLDAYVVERSKGCVRRRIGLIRFIDGPPTDQACEECDDESVSESVSHPFGNVLEKKSRFRQKPWQSFLHARKSLLPMAGIFLATCLVIIGVFLNYGVTLRHEFYQMSIEGMNDYTAAQKVEVEASIHEIKNTISAMVILAETPDIDPQGVAFSNYLAGWNEKQSFQVDYVSLDTLKDALSSTYSLPSDTATLERVQNGENIISEVRYSNRLKGYYYSIAEPIVKDGQVVGALRSVVNASDLLKTSQDSSQVKLLSASLIKGDGSLVLSDNGKPQAQGSFYDVMLGEGTPEKTVAAVQEIVENDSTVATTMLGERDGRMFFFTAIRLGYNDWNIVNITEESGLAEHSDEVLSKTFTTGVVLMAITVSAAFAVFFFFSRMRRKISYETDRYNVLSEFTDTVLFEYSYEKDTLTLTSNARKIFPLNDLRKEHYLEEDIPLVNIHPDDYHLVRNLLEYPVPSGEMKEIIYRAQVLSGDYRWFSCQCRYIYAGLEVCTAVGKIVDIDEQKAYENRLVEQAQIDALTKIYNKGAAELQIEKALIENTSGFLFMIDVDDFKFINDEYGHNTGDRVLAQVGKALTTVFRQSDPVGRTGGDEFIAYLSHADDLAVAEEKARLLSEYMDKVSIDLKVPIGLSIGIARFPSDGVTYKELFKAADKRMYEKKSRTKKRTRQ